MVFGIYAYPQGITAKVWKLIFVWTLGIFSIPVFSSFQTHLTGWSWGSKKIHLNDVVLVWLKRMGFIEVISHVRDFWLTFYKMFSVSIAFQKNLWCLFMPFWHMFFKTFDFSTRNLESIRICSQQFPTFWDTVSPFSLAHSSIPCSEIPNDSMTPQKTPVGQTVDLKGEVKK